PSPTGPAPARGRLARRLLDAGMLAPHPVPAPSTSNLTIVVPARDRPVQLERCLDAVVAACPASLVVVVDDGSTDPGPVYAASARRGARVIRHEVTRGPAAARNSGLDACSTPFVG